MLILIYILLFIFIVFISNTMLYSEEVYVSIGLLCFLLYLFLKIEENFLISWLNDISIENQQIKKSLYDYEYLKLKIQLSFITKILYFLTDVLYYFSNKLLYLLKLYNEETFLISTDKYAMRNIKIDLLLYFLIKKYYINYILYNYNYLYKIYEQKEIVNIKNSFNMNLVKFKESTFEFLTSNWFDNIYTINIELNYNEIEKNHYDLLSFEDELITNLRIKLFTIADDIENNEALKRKNITVQNLKQNNLILNDQLEIIMTENVIITKHEDLNINSFDETTFFSTNKVLVDYMLNLYKNRYQLIENANEIKIKNLFLFFYFNLDLEYDLEDLDLTNMIEIRTLNTISEDFELGFYNKVNYPLFNKLTLTDDYKIMISELARSESNYQRAEEISDLETEDDYYLKDEIILVNEDFLDEFYIEIN